MESMGQQSIKGYELKERIGAGGFGAVYRAHQSTIGREVAVKIILPGLANQPDFIRRFETEAQIVARLEHPHITPLYDYWRDPEGAYLVMRWLRGGNLRDALEHGGFELRAAALLLDQIAGALSLAHRNGVIHRDIKPANILLDEDSNAYLTDFGIAKDLNLPGENTGQDAIVGSLDYISPEQARSEPVTPQTDIYSLGVTLFEIITGHHPFENISSIERLYKHINDPLPEITGVEPSLQEAINRVIQKATAKNPKNRYPDALAFAADFREAVGMNRTSTTVVELLTQREHEILHLIMEGLPNKEIARRLTVTLSTVKWYVYQIYSKLGVRSRVQAIVRARELNLIVKPGETAEPVVVSTGEFQPENPYKGLRAFQSADHPDFFGREKITGRLVKRLGETGAMSRFLAVVGPSGCGKSSLVKAGVIPSLWRGELPGSEKWFIVEMLPGAHPLDELEIGLMKVAANQAASLNEQLRRDPRGLVRAGHLILPNDGTELVLVIDQFEEVFTLVDDESERKHFLDLLYTAVTEPRSRVRVLITLRADFYDRPLYYPQFGDLVHTRLETIMPLSAEELERAITRPAERVGASFEAGLVATIIGDVNYQPGALPLLQYALTELFEQRSGRLLTQSAYQAIGGATGALAKRAEALYQELSDAARPVARQMFLRLVTPGDGTEDTRRRTPRAELTAISPDAEVLEEVIDLYADYRLLSLDNDAETRSPTVEVAHEAMIREWERLREWINESRSDLLFQRQLAYAAGEWEHGRRDDSYLLTGARLSGAEERAGTTTLALTPVEQTYLQASLKRRDQERQAETERQAREKQLERRSMRFLRVLAGVLLLATVGALALTGVVAHQSTLTQQALATSDANFQHAEAQRLAAEANRLVAQSANASADVIALLAIRSLQTEYTPQGDEALIAATSLHYPTRRFSTSGSSFVVFSPDGKQLLLVNRDTETAALLDIASGQEVIHFDTGHINFGVFSPDGTAIVTTESDGTIRMWDRQTGQEIQKFEGYRFAAIGVGFSSDGQQLYVGTFDHAGSVKVWNVKTGLPVDEFKAGADESALPSPDGKYAVFTDSQGNIRLVDTRTRAELSTTFNAFWGTVITPDNQSLLTMELSGDMVLHDLKTGQTIQTFRGFNTGLTTAVFSQDGKLLAGGGDDNTVRVWDVATGEERLVLNDHLGAISQVNFSPDNRYIASLSHDGVVLLWDLQEQGEHPQFAGHQDLVITADIAPDGQTIVTGGIDGTARLWNAKTGAEIHRIENGEPVWHVTFSPDGRSFVTSGEASGTSRMWDVQTGDLVREFTSMATGSGESASFSDDGKSLLTVNWMAGDAPNGTYVWDVATGKLLKQFPGIPGIEAELSPDGKALYVGNGDSAGLYDSSNGKLRFNLPGGGWFGDFAPDGRTLVTAGEDSVVELWDVATGQLVRQFVGHTDRVYMASFSHDGRFVLSSSNDHTARIWDTATGQEVRRITLPMQIRTGLFSPDDHLILLAGSSDAPRLLDADYRDTMAYLCSRLLRDFTPEERQQYSLSDDATTCP